jgi:hypothetical protein
MDERDDYVDRDLPPPPKWLTQLLITIGLGVFFFGLCMLALMWAAARTFNVPG